MNIAKLKSKAEGLVTQLTAKDACEKRVLDAIATHSYPAPRSLLNEIAEDTFSHDRYGWWGFTRRLLLLLSASACCWTFVQFRMY